MKMFFVVTALSLFFSVLLDAASGDVDAGKSVFMSKCKTCHGSEGEGNPAIAKMLKVEIPDLRSKQVQSLADSELKTVIDNGKGKMKPVAGLNGKQVEDVIAFLRTLAKP